MATVKGKKQKAEVGGRYLNRELSWLEFNRRVLTEATNPKNPLLERAKFLAIFESNLDEFYMVRVSGLMEQEESGISELSPDGLSAAEQVELIHETAFEKRVQAGQIWEHDLRPKLAEEGVTIIAYADLDEKRRLDLDERFRAEIFPVCTPLMLDPNPRTPIISGRSLNLAVVLQDEAGLVRLARVKVPDVGKRALRIGRRHEYVLLEDVMRHNLHHLFPGVRIAGAYLFRVIRDADFEIRELEAGDLIETVEQTLRLRRFGDPVLLEVEAAMPEEVRATLRKLLTLDEDDVFPLEGLIGFGVFWELASIDRATLKYPPFAPYLDEALSKSGDLFAAITEGDILVHHPFDSFRSVEAFVASAARDPRVIGIKQTLYRVGAESPIVESLLEAAEAGKQVAVMVELKARFDESNNLGWARALERAGAHVTYGFPDLKTHCKLCLVVRREGSSIRTYAHVGTGNYNPSTARLYTDFGLFTDDPDITADAAELFNYLTGFSRQRQYRKLLVAPINLRDEVQRLIRRETALGKKGRILMKMNSLVDPQMIDALYEASQAGVEIDLIVRGICCLRPGVTGLSDHIRVLSLVGRFLEHSRVLFFGNGGAPEAYIGSADLMRRNLDRRVEVLAPVESKRLVDLLGTILQTYLEDHTNAWDLDGDGVYTRRHGKGAGAQKWFMSHPATRA